VALRGKIARTSGIVSAVLSIVVNGSRCRYPDKATIADLIRELALEGKRIAVERNGQIVPKSRHDDTLLAEGDCIEVVRAVGGG
jgi:sulfur carrier protein